MSGEPSAEEIQGVLERLIRDEQSGWIDGTVSDDVCTLRRAYDAAVARAQRAEAALVELRWWGEHTQSCFSPTFEAWKWLGVTPDELQRHVDAALMQPAAAGPAGEGE